MIAQRFGFTGDFSRERDSRSIADREKFPVESKIKRGRVANGKSGFKPPPIFPALFRLVPDLRKRPFLPRIPLIIHAQGSNHRLQAVSFQLQSSFPHERDPVCVHGLAGFPLTRE